MKRNLLKICLLFVSMFTAFSCSASPSVVDTADTSESIPTAKQWNKDVVGWNLSNEFELLDRMASRCRLATLMVPSMQRQLGAIPLSPKK